MNPTIDQVVQHYGNRVRIISRDSLLRCTRMPKAHEAGRCAAEQGQFSPMHNRMRRPGRVDAGGLKKSAVALGMDAARFNSCLDSGKHEAAVQRRLPPVNRTE